MPLLPQQRCFARGMSRFGTVVLDLRSLRKGVSTARVGGAKDKGSSFPNRALMLRSNSAHRSFPHGSEMVVRQGPGRPDDAAKFVPLHR
jgi:hypothetical protein